MSSTVRIDLGARSYDIVVGEGLLARAGELIAPVLPSKCVIVVADGKVPTRHLQALEASLATAALDYKTIPVPRGEGSKSFKRLEWLCNQILAEQPDRKTTIIAFGGGVVGDLAGFAASILLRGLPFVQIPTTLLAQVDSSVGGKTAINAKSGKNLIGSFYQPLCVIADTATLTTLRLRERRAGYAEIIKYGLIMNPDFYRWCLANGNKVIAGNSDARQYAIAESCRMKAEIVGADEREAGRRALLNFGHTFAHALEAETGMSSKLLHGEAVAIGMVMACRLSAKMGLIAPEVEQELTAHFKKIGLPTSPRDIVNDWDASRIAAHFAGDKKAEGGKLTFVVLEAVGNARVEKNVDYATVRGIVASYLE